jgi:peptidyl-dipeptidase Dcp
MVNPLLTPPARPFGAVPFREIKLEHFVPAVTEAIRETKARIAAVRDDQAPPTFANTFVALENAGDTVWNVSLVYGNLRSAHGDPAMQALAKEIMPKLIQLDSDTYLDEALFARVKAAYAALPQTLTVEQRTLADKAFRAFKRNGALLDAAGKAKLRALDEQLSTLGPEFSEHVLKATNAYELVVTDEKDLAGLPESTRQAAAETAKERGKAGAWVFTLHAPSYLPVMKYADNRELRRQLFVAQGSRATSGESDNRALVVRIARLRHQRAELLGYKSHAHFQLEERMAETPERVRAFLDRLLEKSLPAARREIAELAQFAASEGGAAELMPWDYAYWADKLKERRYKLNAEELRPYFPLQSVLDGAFEHAKRLYDLDFRPATNVEVYADDVQVFEVLRGGKHIGLFYADFFPRPTKSGGAWCSRFRSQWVEDGASQRPHVTIVCNFTKPTATKPALLTQNEATTLFHEFGHALHSLLSQCEFRSLSCTSVYRDFVELPSQIMENWLAEKESLALFARHYETGEVLPDHYVQKIIASDRFHAAYMTVRQLRFGYLDLAWYGGDPGDVQDVLAFEQRAVAATDLFPPVPGTNMSCSFEHIFSGGYSAGYYSYKWAEVLDADAFELFKEKGIFAKDVADRFRSAILERGGSDHPMRLYKEFRGREPDPDALLRRAGLI